LTILCLLLLIFPAPIYACAWQNSATPAGNCGGLKPACSAAAAELKAARALIAGYEAQIAAADERIDLARREIQSLKELSMMEGERAEQLEKVIAAEQEAKAILLRRKEEQEKRIASLEKQLGRSKKFALIAGVAAGVAILIGASK